ncbi:MAG: hypothetical protein IMF11_10305, partial [Proteobacteria bacterium]|nr:hypothetical protein [Pseudomonadota bacterium]
MHGTAYFDARWPAPGDKKVSGYAFYDRAIHNAARLVEKSRSMPVVLDSQQKLFEPGQCPGAALYCGWYRLAHYVDAFTWKGYQLKAGHVVISKSYSRVGTAHHSTQFATIAP